MNIFVKDQLLTYIAHYANAEVDLAFAENKAQFDAARKRVQIQWDRIESIIDDYESRLAREGPSGPESGRG